MNIVQLASKEGRGFKEVLVHVDRRTITLTQVTVFVCLSVVYRPLLENIPLIWRRHHGDDGRSNGRSRLGSYEQGGIFIVPHLLWQGALGLWSHPKRLPKCSCLLRKARKQKIKHLFLSFLFFCFCLVSYIFFYFFFVIQTWCNTTLSPGSVALNYTRTFFISVLTARRRYQVI